MLGIDRGAPGDEAEDVRTFVENRAGFRVERLALDPCLLDRDPLLL
jgi:hypothetical protein